MTGGATESAGSDAATSRADRNLARKHSRKYNRIMRRERANNGAE